MIEELLQSDDVVKTLQSQRERQVCAVVVYLVL